MQANIFVFGVIGDNAEDGEVGLKDVISQLKTYSSFDSIMVHINSVGGDVMEGYAINKYLRDLKKPITTKINGKCYSIATVVALAGDKRIMSENSDYMIHNPWMGNQQGDSKHFEKVANQLKQEEDKLAVFYAKETGIPVEQVKELMAEETYMTAKQAKEYGFVTEKEEGQLKAVAKLKTEIKMDEVKKKEAINILAQIKKAVGMDTTPVAEMDEEEKKDTPKSMVLEDGEFMLEDGRMITVREGVVELKMESMDDESNEEAEAMKKKISDLESQLAQAKSEVENSAKAVQASKEENEAKIKALAEQVEKFSNLVVSDDAPKAVGKKNVTAKAERVDEGAQKLAQMREKQMEVKSFYN